MTDENPSVEICENVQNGKKNLQLAKAREIAAEKRRAMGNLTKVKKENKERAYKLIVEEEAEKQRVIMERFKELERKKVKSVRKKPEVIEEELQQEPLLTDSDEEEPKVVKKKPRPPPSDTDSSEDEKELRKRARREVRKERDAVLAERYRKNVDDIKLQELKSILRGGRY